MICPKCGKELTKGSLVEHRQTQHGVSKGGLGQVGDEEGGGDEPRTYMMLFPEKAGTRHFPVEECSGRTEKWTVMRVHFWNRHVRDTVVILEEGNLSHPRCPLCDILVTWRSLSGMHRHTTQ